MDARAKLGWFYVAVLAIVTAICLVLPLLIADGTALGLDGRAGRMDSGQLWSGLDPFSAAVYSLGDLMCHQMESRSIVIGGNQMPMCIREFSMVVGALAGMVLSQFVRDRMDSRFIAWAAVSVLLIMFAPAEWAYASYVDADVGMSAVAFSGAVSGFGFALLLQCVMGFTFGRRGRGAARET